MNVITLASASKPPVTSLDKNCLPHLLTLGSALSLSVKWGRPPSL